MGSLGFSADLARAAEAEEAQRPRAQCQARRPEAGPFCLGVSLFGIEIIEASAVCPTSASEPRKCMPDHIAGEAYLADYLLYRLNLGWPSPSSAIPVIV